MYLDVIFIDYTINSLKLKKVNEIFIRKELYDKFSKMTKDELKRYFENMLMEQNLNFEKEIKGTVYKVNTYFSKDSEYTILQDLFRIFRK